MIYNHVTYFVTMLCDAWDGASHLSLNKTFAMFFSHHWNVRINPDVAFVSVGHDNWLLHRCFLGKFPGSQHQSSFLIPLPPRIPAYKDPLKHLNLIGSTFAFSQVNLLIDRHFRTQQTSRRHTKNCVRACYLWLNNPSHVTVTRTMSHVGTESFLWAPV